MPFLQQTDHFLEESAVLEELLSALPEEEFARVTLFNGWTLDDILGHLHVWNDAAASALSDPGTFATFRASLQSSLPRTGLRAFEESCLAGVRGRARFESWWAGCHRLASLYRDADPRRRVQWVGPDMSATSAITSRQMETWAHGQAIFDLLGRERIDGDRLRNVAHLGVATFGWSFRNRGLEVPHATPRVRLRAPSGAVWTWNTEVESDCVEGTATEFCQVVAQTRNVADTRLEVRGETARRWMAIAQCFAGPPVDPPAPGTRFRTTS